MNTQAIIQGISQATGAVRPYQAGARPFKSQCSWWTFVGCLTALNSGLMAAELPADVGTVVAGYQDDFGGDALSAAWQRTGSDLDPYTVTQGMLQIRSAVGDPNHLVYGVPGYDEVTQEVLARIRIRSFGSGDQARAGVAVGVDPFSSQGINYHFRDVDSEGQVGRHTSFLDDLREWGPGYDFVWQNDTWYRVRLRQEVDAADQGGVNDVFAKIWAADGVAAEPVDWQPWDYVPGRPARSGYAGITAGSSGGFSEFDVDYILIKAAGLPQILVAPDAFPLFEAEAVIVQPPEDLEVAEGSSAEFVVLAEGYPSPTYQWFRDDVPIPGETNAVYRIGAVSYADDGAQFHAEARNVANGVAHVATSEVAVLTVVPDQEPPRLLGAASAGLIMVEVRFSERVSAENGTAISNYGIVGESGTIEVLNVTLDGTQAVAVLTVAPLAEGVTYTLTVEGITDQSAAANPIVAGASVVFTATSFRMKDIGGGGVLGQLTPVPGGYDVIAAGTSVGGANDACFFASLPRAGDFDLRVRLEALGPGEVWAKAGLMARSSADPDAAFVSVFGTPANVGVGFMARLAPGTAALQEGYFPVNYPNTWLRLRRAGGEWTGYASLDNREWTRLGSAVMDLGASVDVGFVVASQHADRTVEARFRDYGAVTEATAALGPPPFEPLLQSSRLTPVVISEIMYHPVDPALEFIELANTFATDEDIGGYRLSGQIDFVFPEGSVLPGGAYVVVARDPTALRARYGLSNVLGPWVGGLSNNGGTVRLRHRTGAVFLEIEYGRRAVATRGGWGGALVGAGTTVLRRGQSPGLGGQRWYRRVSGPDRQLWAGTAARGGV